MKAARKKAALDSPGSGSSSASCQSSGGVSPTGDRLGISVCSLSSANIQMAFDHIPVYALYELMTVSKFFGECAKSTATIRRGTPHYLRTVVIQDFPNDVCASGASEEPVDVEQSNVDMDIVWEECGGHFRPIPYPLAIKTVAAAFEFQAQRDQGHSAIPRVDVTSIVAGLTAPAPCENCERIYILHGSAEMEQEMEEMDCVLSESERNQDCGSVKDAAMAWIGNFGNRRSNITCVLRKQVGRSDPRHMGEESGHSDDDSERDHYESLESYLASRGVPLNAPLGEPQEPCVPKAGYSCSFNSTLYLISFDETNGLEAAVLTVAYRRIMQCIQPPHAWREARCKHERLPACEHAKELPSHAL
jgi:hypothetical protein